jgi:hypothetical protein
LQVITKLTGRHWAERKQTLLSFFVPCEASKMGASEYTKLEHRRVASELAKSLKFRERQSAAAEARHHSGNARARASFFLIPKDSKGESLSNTSSTDRSESLDRDGRSPEPAMRPSLAKNFENFWKAYPKRAGSNPRKPASDKFELAVKSGIDPETIIAAAKAYAGECDRIKVTNTEKVAQAVTWLTQHRWTDYAGIQHTGPPAHLTARERAEWVWARLDEDEEREKQRMAAAHAGLLEQGQSARQKNQR